MDQGVEKDGEALQAQGNSSRSVFVNPGLANRIRAMEGGGNVLPARIREPHEARFGSDLSMVRVHTDQEAADVSRSLGAKAFAVGRDIFFAMGRFSPATRVGQRLLAHELTHVVQRDGSRDTIRPTPDPKPEEKKGRSGKVPKVGSFTVDLAMPKKNPKPDFSKTDTDIGAWEKAVFLGKFRFAFDTESTTMRDNTPGSYVSSLSIEFEKPAFSVRIARHLYENATDKTKQADWRIKWKIILRRVHKHAYVHLGRFRKAAAKMEKEIQKSIGNLPTSAKPLGVRKADLDDYMTKLGSYLSARVELELWKTTCDWEKKDYPRLLKGIPGVFGTLKLNCGPRPRLPPTPGLPIPVRTKRKSVR
jgi:hypothetical protein